MPGTAWAHENSNNRNKVSSDNDTLENRNIDAFILPEVHNPLGMRFPAVQNLDNILPITSTPAQEENRRDLGRLSTVRPRGRLRLENDASTQPNPDNMNTSSSGDDDLP